MFPTRRIVTSGGDVFRDEYSLAFDGTDDYVDCGSDSSLDVGTSDFTACCWFKLVDDGDNHDIISKGTSLTSNTQGWSVAFLETNKTIKFDVGESEGKDDATSSAISYDRWYHIAVVRNNSGDHLQIYIDGIADGAEASHDEDDLADASVNFKIGTSGSNRYLNGNISDVAYYNTVLSASQVATIYNGREPYNHKEGVASSSLVSWWRMGDGRLDSFPLLGDEVNPTLGPELSPNLTCDSNITGWESYSSGTASHETTITHSGAGSLKVVFDGSNHWNFRSSSAIGSIENLSTYLITGYVYIPAGYGGGNIFLTTADQFGGGQVEVEASSSITGVWQYIKTVFNTVGDTTGKVYGRTVDAGDPDADDIVYFDDISIRKVNGNSGFLVNMAVGDKVGDTP